MVRITIYRTDIVARLLRDYLRINTRVRMFLLSLGLDLVMFYGLSYLTGTFWSRPGLAIAASQDVLRAVSGLLFMPLALSFYIGQLGYYPQVFNRLYLDGAFDLTQAEFEAFMKRLERRYNWLGWHVIALLFLTMTFSFWIPVQLRLPLNWYVSPFPWTFLLLRVPYNCLQWYILVMISFRHVVTWVAVLRLTKNSKLILKPLHPDGCGGLEPLGRLLLYILPAAAFVAMHLFTLAVRENSLGYPLTHFDLMFVWVYYFVVVVSSILIPVLPVHRLMEEARGEFARRALMRAQSLMDDIDTELRSGDRPFAITDQLDQLREIGSMVRSLPRWPLRVADIYSATFAVFAPLVFGVITEIITALVLGRTP